MRGQAMDSQCKDTVVEYYDSIAATYDESRFGGSYGRFIDEEERKILDALFPSDKQERRLELGCGTGRLTEYAGCALDASAEMLAIAKKRHDSVEFTQAFADRTGYADDSFDAVYAFHMLMHLEPEVIENIFRETNRILKPGGRFVFDIPSKNRRRLLGHDQRSWHCGTAMSQEDIVSIAAGFSLGQSFGIMLMPVHILPEGIRQKLLSLDIKLANGIMKGYSSYLVFELIKESSPDRENIIS